MNIKAITSTVIAGVILFAACRKDDSMSSDDGASTSDCVVQQSTENGRIIPDQYIIAYNPSTSNSLSSTARIASFSNNLLQRNNISSTALRQSFAGAPGSRALGGFIARLSGAELARLKADTSIRMIEQDRIVAYGTCFQVVEPKTITWNVNRVGYGDGTGKTAWIIDSGIDFTHPDLNADATRSK